MGCHLEQFLTKKMFKKQGGGFHFEWAILFISTDHCSIFNSVGMSRDDIINESVDKRGVESGGEKKGGGNDEWSVVGGKKSMSGVKKIISK